MRMFESVLFPAPFSPSSACTSPAAASRSTESFASTPGKCLVIPRMRTAGEAPGSPAPLAAGTEGAWCPTGLAGRGNVGDGPDDALHEPLHRVQVLDPEALSFRDRDLAALVVDRAAELVEAVVHDRLLLRRDRRLGLRTHLRPERRELGEAVLDRAIVEARLPGAVHRRLDALQVVRAPVVDGRRQPLRGRELLRVRVVADPCDAVLLGEHPGCGT